MGPIATTFGQNIVLIVTGSFLIETIFDINGFGLLGVNAIVDREYDSQKTRASASSMLSACPPVKNCAPWLGGAGVVAKFIFGNTARRCRRATQDEGAVV